MINFSIISDWNHGFTGNLSFTNVGTASIDGWTLEFEAPFEITTIWDAKILSRDGSRYTIQHEGWNGQVAPDQTISFGFNGKGSATEPTGYAFNGTAIAATPDPATPDPVTPEPVTPEPVTPDPVTIDPMEPEHNHGDDHQDGEQAQGDEQAQGGEHNHVEAPLPDDINTEPLAEGGQVFSRDGGTQRITNFNPATDKVDIGTDSIHNQIPIDTPDGLVFHHMFDPSRTLTLEGITLKDLTAENFNPIADAHLQQDLSAALAWENGTAHTRANTVYVRSHEEGLAEVVDFNPATDKISFFYLSVRGDDQLNFSVEQTEEGVRFFSPVTGQSITLKGIQFSDLESSHFEWRANQLEDNIAGRMGLSDKIDNFGIVDANIFSGKSVPMAGLVDRAPYHTNYPNYTGTGSAPNPVPVGPVDPVTPPAPVDPIAPITPAEPIQSDHPSDPSSPIDPAPTANSGVNFEITNDWGNGYQGEVNVTNNTSTDLDGWTLEFEFSGKITQVWNAQIVSHSGNTYVIRNASYNGAIAPGQEVSFGFLGEGSTATLPSMFTLNGTVVGSKPDPVPSDPVAPVTDDGDGHNHGGEQPQGGEHNHGEAPLPDDINTEPLAEGGQVFSRDGGTQRITNFNPATDKVDIGTDSIHNQIPIDTPDGLVFHHMFDPSRTLTLEGITLKDLTAENFNPIADAHLQQDLSAALAWENGTAHTRANTVYIRSHEEGLAEVVDFNPATDKISFFYLSVRGDDQLNFSVEQTEQGVRFYSPVTGQSITLKGIQFSDLNSSHFEWRANQLEDNIAGRMGLSDKIDNFRIVDANIFSGKSVPMAGLVDRAPYHTNYPDYTGTSTPVDSPPTPVDPVDPVVPVEPIDPVDTAEPIDPIDPVDPIAPVDPIKPIEPVEPEIPVNPAPPQTGDFNYGEALQKSLLFYDAQRSGPLPEGSRIEWRDDSAVNDGADVGVDLSGGYYDAGDHVKFGFPMASSMTMLGWGVVQYREAYEQSGQLDEALEAIKWGTDYILNAHITDGQGTQEFWGQVGDGYADHAYWGPAEEMTMDRPSFKIDRQNPGSDLAGESAAALAAASIIFKDSDPAYSARLLDNAKQLFAFADQYRGAYSDAISNASSFYNSWSGYMDELSWSATWLHKATGDRAYLGKAEQYYQGLNPQWTQSWDNKSYGAATLLAQATGKAKYKQDAESWLNHWTDKNNGIQYTSGGLAWLDQWGSTRYSANTAFIAGIYSDTVNDYGDRYANFAEDQIDYLLGDNPNNFSYMVGFGDNYALNPHHRSAHGDYNISDPEPNDNILYGALVGGPASPNDNDYSDVRSDYIRNEVALDYNAGFTGALVRLYDQFGGDPLTDRQLDSLPGVEVAEV